MTFLAAFVAVFIDLPRAVAGAFRELPGAIAAAVCDVADWVCPPASGDPQQDAIDEWHILQTGQLPEEDQC